LEVYLLEYPSFASLVPLVCVLCIQLIFIFALNSTNVSVRTVSSSTLQRMAIRSGRVACEHRIQLQAAATRSPIPRAFFPRHFFNRLSQITNSTAEYAQVVAINHLAISLAVFRRLSASVVALIHGRRSPGSEGRFQAIEAIEVQLLQIDGIFTDGIQIDNLRKAADAPTAQTVKFAVKCCIAQVRLLEGLIERVAVGPAESDLSPDATSGSDKYWQAIGKETATVSRSLEIFKATITTSLPGATPGDEEAQSALYRLVDVELSHSEYTRARDVLESLLRIQSSQLPSRNGNLMRTIAQLADVYRQTNSFLLAQICCEMTLMENVKRLGPQHPDTMVSLERLAIVFRNISRLDEARRVYQQILRFRETSLGWEHPHTIRVAMNYGITLMQTRKCDEGVRLLEKATEGLENLLSLTHLDTAWSREHLSDAKHIRDGTFTKHVYQFVLQTAIHFKQWKERKLASEEVATDVDTSQCQGHDFEFPTGQRGRFTEVDTEGLTPRPVSRPARGGTNPSPEPRLSWDMLNAVSDASGTGNIQSAAVHKAWKGDSWYPDQDGQPHEMKIASLLRGTMTYTFSDLLETPT